MKRLIFLLVLISVLSINIKAQQVTISEEWIDMKTYPFSDPDPVANIGRIYPYFRFDGYTNTAIDKKWKMVVLENEYLKVFVCPDIGGKIYGAIEKSTGKEFLYFNHVVKFRDIAMRGAWTSGGLEYNFGDIGHIPTCATPVDYFTRENSDGSVSCFVGAIDLPSNTRWNIEIKLAPGNAFYETKVSWFNNSPLAHTYYHWMNAAAKADGNLEFFYPGKNRIGHGGETADWPYKEERNLSKYEENNFGIYKSHHVMNSYSDFFGGYWLDDDFGFGHYTTYDEKPGKKLWIWGLSDQGMIWEDLLTDDDGQYIEYQSGKLFNQASASSTFTPFKHREFAPYDADIMRDVWFPVKNTKGMLAASEYGILNIEQEADSIIIYLNALQYLSETISIKIGEQEFKNKIELKPMQLHKTILKAEKDAEINISLGNHLLNYSSNKNEILTDRPINPNPDFNWESAYGIYTKALELEKQRSYPEALNEYLRCLTKDPGFMPALSRLSLAYYRLMDYEQALNYSTKAISIDTYDAEANYAHGLANLQLKNITEAKAAFSIASHSIGMRSAAHIELAKIYLTETNYEKAKHYALKAIEYNKNSINALEILAYSYRKQKKLELAKEAIAKIYSLDALSDFAKFEEFQLDRATLKDFNSKITNELPHESYLSLALLYKQFNDAEAAIEILKESPKHPMIQLWLAYLSKTNRVDYLNKALDASAKFVFPYRNESSLMLESLSKINPHWKLKYYLGLIYWDKGLTEKSKELFLQCGDQPDFPAFYLAKAELFNKDKSIIKASLEKAHQMAPNDWRSALELSNFYLDENNAKKAIDICEPQIKLHPETTAIGLCYTKALVANKQFKKALKFLENYVILPYEGAQDGKKMYTEVCIKLAVEALENKKIKQVVSYAEQAKQWPLNLGVGKPYDVDERIENYLLAQAYELRGDFSKYEALVKHNQNAFPRESSKLYFQAMALTKLGKQDEALKLINQALNKDPKNKYVQWVKAKFENSPKADLLQEEILNSNTQVKAYDTAFVDEDFRFVLELLQYLQ